MWRQRQSLSNGLHASWAPLLPLLVLLVLLLKSFTFFLSYVLPSTISKRCPAGCICCCDCAQVGEVIGDKYELYAAHGKGVFSSVLRARDLGCAECSGSTCTACYRGWHKQPDADGRVSG